LESLLDQVTVSLKRWSISEGNANESASLKTVFSTSLDGKLRAVIVAVQKGNLDTVLQTIHSNPELLDAQSSVFNCIQSPTHLNLFKHFFITIGIHTGTINQNTLHRRLTACSCRRCSLKFGSALHHTASQGLYADLLPILLEHWKDGASKANQDGDSQLHLDTLNGQRYVIE
jgi:hypothetical protein